MYEGPLRKLLRGFADVRRSQGDQIAVASDVAFQRLQAVTPVQPHHACRRRVPFTHTTGAGGPATRGGSASGGTGGSGGSKPRW